MDSRLAFAGYEEGPILFRPTYKYNVGTDEYDTSEKMRVPAWTGTHPWDPSPPITLTSKQTEFYTEERNWILRFTHVRN